MRKKYDLDLKAIGKRLKNTRETLEVTLEKMQQITGFSKSLISAAEKGQKKPSAIYLFALLDRYKVDLNYIFTGNGNMFLHGFKPEQRSNEQSQTLEEMIYMIENVELVRYAMLTEYIKFKAQNKNIIGDTLQETDKK